MYRVFYHILGPLLRLAFRVRVEGRENIPDCGGVIFAINHDSFWDSPIVLAVLPLRLRTMFTAKGEYFRGTTWPRRVFAWLASIYALPVCRDGDKRRPRDNENTLLALEHHLRKGHAVGNHLEGTRTPVGHMYGGRLGSVQQARRTGVPIIPTVILGARDRGFPGAVTVRFGEPIEFEEYAHHYDTLQRQEDIRDTRKVACAIAKLGGLRYIDKVLTPAEAKRLREQHGHPFGSAACCDAA